MRVGCLRVTRGRVAESDCRPSHPLVQFFWPDFNLLSFVGVGVYIYFFIYDVYGSDDERSARKRARGRSKGKQAALFSFREVQIQLFSPDTAILTKTFSSFLPFH